MIIGKPVAPYRGVRDTDAYGSGTFAASRDGGSRAHLGRDYVAQAGDDVLAPIDGTVRRIVKAYPDADLGGVEIDGPTCRVKMLYLRPEVPAGMKVRRGQKIGTAQDVAAYHEKKSPRSGRMVNHVHVELMLWVDPANYMEHEV